MTNARLIACHSRDATRAQDFARRHSDLTVHPSLADVVADDRVNAVYVATPNDLHAEQAVACLRGGKHVMIDKPLARGVSDAVRIRDAAMSSGRTVGLMHQARFHPAHRELMQKVRGGALGELTCIRAQIGIWFPPGDNWRLDPARSGGGAAMDLAPHVLDIMLQLGGPVSHASAWMGNLRFAYAVEDYCHARLEFARGGIGVLEMSYGVHAYGGRLEVYGSLGTHRVDGGFQAAPAYTVSHRTAEANDWTEERHALREDPFVSALADFTSAIQAGRQPMVTAEDGIAELQWIERMYESAR